MYGSGPDMIARVARDNPADLLFSTGLQPGELALYVNYPGRDNYNFDAQAQSFAWLAAQRGIAVELADIPMRPPQPSLYRTRRAARLPVAGPPHFASGPALKDPDERWPGHQGRRRSGGRAASRPPRSRPRRIGSPVSENSGRRVSIDWMIISKGLQKAQGERFDKHIYKGLYASQPYLYFDGRCEEAIEFYRDALGAEVLMLMRFKDNPECRPTSRHPVRRRRQGDARDPPHRQYHCVGFRRSMPGAAELSGLFAVADRTGRGRGRPVVRRSRRWWASASRSPRRFFPRFGMLADRFGVGWLVYVAS